MPVNSTEKFVDILEETDFMIEDDDDEGVGGYADCEMLADPEPTTFRFENLADLKADTTAISAQIETVQQKSTPL